MIVGGETLMITLMTYKEKTIRESLYIYFALSREHWLLFTICYKTVFSW